MIFPERVLPIGNDPVPEHALIVGEVYFKVHFADDDCLSPTVLPFAFLGRGAAGCPDNYLVFQDESYLTGAPPTGASLHLFTVGNLQGVYFFDVALDILCEVWLRRQDLKLK